MNQTTLLTKRAREAHITRKEPADGGSSVCLSALVRYYGEDIDPVQLQSLTLRKAEGSSLLHLHQAALKLGFKSSAYAADLNSLMDHCKPTILHLVRENGIQQFVVCYGFDGSYFVLGDPETGVYKIIPKKLLQMWQTRTLLSLEPESDFQVKLRQHKQNYFKERSLFDRQPQSERYSAVGMNGELIGVNKMLLFSTRSNASRIMASGQAQIVLAMQEFDTLENHLNTLLDRYATSFIQGGLVNTRIDADSTLTPESVNRLTRIRKQGLEQSLEKLVNEGFLVSESEIRGEILDHCARSSGSDITKDVVQSLGIPTCNRPGSLRAALQSFIQNVKHHNRDITFYVSDDSRDEKGREATKHVIRTLEKKRDVKILYGDRVQREQFTDTLSDHMIVSPEILRFAFLGDGDLFAAGAARNTLLAAAAGEMQVQVDDDTLCQLASSPEAENGVEISARFEVNKYWFHADFEDSIADVTFIEKDFFQLHEELLGVPVSSVLNARVKARRDLRVESINNEILRDISTPDARVAVSFLGLAGDCAMGGAGNLGFLFLDSDSLRRLVENRDRYSAKMSTRYVKRVPNRRILTDHPACMTMNIGLDATEVLPPFMPINRNEDGVFGAAHRASGVHTFKGYLPYMLLHHPPDERTFRPSISDSIASPRVNDLIRMVVMTYESNLVSDDTSKNIGLLGEYLQMLGTLDMAEFQHQIFPIARQSLTRHLVSAELHLQRHADAPDYWKNDLREYIETYQQKLTEPEFLIPYDLPGDAEMRIRLCQRFVGQYGTLLSLWPDIFQAVRELKQKGRMPFAPLT